MRPHREDRDVEQVDQVVMIHVYLGSGGRGPLGGGPGQGGN